MKELLLLVPENGSLPSKAITEKLESISSYKAGKNFTYKKYTYDSFPEFVHENVLPRADCFMILGKLTEFGETQYEQGKAFPRRKKKERPTIQDREGPELVLDLDDPIIEGFDALSPETAIKGWLKKRSITCDVVWQITGSQRLNTEKARLRLYFQADKNYTLNYRKEWAESNDIQADGCVYTCSQPIYTAPPIIIDKGRDPIKTRYGFIKGCSRTHKLPKTVTAIKTSTQRSGCSHSDYDFGDPNLPQDFLDGTIYRRYLLPLALHLANKGNSRYEIYAEIKAKSEKSPREFNSENIFQFIDGALEIIECEKGSKKYESNALDELLKYSANGSSEEMKKQMLKDVFVLKGLAILGQWTVFYGAPNTGKTLITLWLTCQSIKDEVINGADVFYANCDDTYRGSVEKLTIAEENGFNILIPNQNDFSAEKLVSIMELLTKSGQAKGKIVILDTLKKFTDLMDKKLSSEFGKMARMFVGAGGTLICLAHVNKRKGDDGKSIHAGTSDIKDDADGVYTIEHTGEESINGGIRHTVEFEVAKSRGDVERKAAYQYFSKKGEEYRDLFDSVNELSESDMENARSEADRLRIKMDDKLIIESVRKIIVKESLGKTELVKRVVQETGEPRRKVIKSLDYWTGGNSEGAMWNVEKQIRNKQLYTLNELLSTA